MEQIFNTLHDFFNSLGLPLEQDSELTVHPLAGLHHPEPMQAPPFRANYYAFVLIEGGKSCYTVNGQTFGLGPRSFYFTNPGQLKSFAIELPLAGYLLTFSEQFLRQHFTEDFFQRFPFLAHETIPVLRLTEQASADLATLFAQMRHEYLARSAYRNPVLANYLHILFYKTKELLVAHQAVALGAPNRGAEIAQEFKGLLQRNFADLFEGRTGKVLSVKEYARLLHVHPSHLSAVLRAETGKSPTDWLQERTLAEARALLANPARTVSEIAWQLGFADTSHFAKFFRRHTGQAPGRYRQQAPVLHLPNFLATRP